MLLRCDSPRGASSGFRRLVGVAFIGLILAAELVEAADGMLEVITRYRSGVAGV